MNFIKSSCGILTITAALAMAVQAQSFLTNGLVAYYPLNGNANDQFGNGNAGSLENGAFYTNGILGEPNAAVYCDGVNAYVLFGKNDSVYPNQVLTWSLWFKAEALCGIIFWDDDSQPGGDRGITISCGDEQLYGGSAGQFIQSTGIVVTVGQWQHAVFTSDVAGQRLYLDGRLISSTGVTIADHTGRSSVSVGAGNCTCGGPNQASGDRFKGAISKVRIYNRALSALEVQQLDQYESTPPQSFLTNGLVAYYPFNGNANDASGNDNDGSVVGTDWRFGSDRFGQQNALYLNTTSAPSCCFDGTYVTAARPTSLDFNGDFTMSVWVNIPSTIPPSYSHNFISNGPDQPVARGTNGVNLRITASVATGDNLEFIYNHQDGDVQLSVNPLRDTWWQAVLVHSGTNVRVFRNGSFMTNVVMTSVVPNSPAIWLGRQICPGYPTNCQGAYPLVGGIDDVRFYNRAFFPSEVQELYAYESTPENLRQNLAAYYPFSGNAVDQTGNGNDGVVNAAVLTADRFGNPNQAYHFNGTNAYIQVSHPVTSGQPFTWSVWFRPDFSETNVSAHLISQSAPPFLDSPALAINAWPERGGAGSVGFYTFDSTWHLIFSTAQSRWDTNSWYQAIVTSDAAGTRCLFLNGSLQVTATNLAFGQLNPNFYIGGPSPSWWFTGDIDDVRIYNRALSALEVQQLYQYESVFSPPTLSAQPQSVTVQAHGSAAFSVTATGALLNYQWLFNGTNISGVTASSFSITNVIPANLGAYAVVVSNAAGSVTSSNAVLSMYPFLASPFQGLVTDWGFTNTLSVGAWGTGPLSYQWFDNGVAIPNATNQTLTLTSIQFTNAGLYSVVVSNALGSVTNPPAQVVVNPAGVSLGMYPGVTVSGVVGYTYDIQRSTDLTDTNAWSTVATLTLIEPVQLWVDTKVKAALPTNMHRFYRVLPGQ